MRQIEKINKMSGSNTLNHHYYGNISTTPRHSSVSATAASSSRTFTIDTSVSGRRCRENRFNNFFVANKVNKIGRIAN